MRIASMLEGPSPVFSFEFFPPRTEAGVASLFSTIAHLRELEPSFVSVTYGAGGSTRSRTVELVRRIRSELDIEPMAHFTCVGSTRRELHEVLGSIRAAGVENVLALRGDPPNGQDGFIPAEDGLSHGSELAGLIHHDYDFCIGGACYPEGHIESPGIEAEIEHARAKVESGVSFLITQLFFDNPAYFDFVARARTAGIRVPIIPGIMPITNVDQITRFTQRIGATIPGALYAALNDRRDDAEAVVQLGVAWATLQCSRLLAGGAPGIHFYTLNRSPATRAILSALLAARPWNTGG
ncbi:MAG: methylenetetrahydrofolate reductase [NAD(P)H] [Candidatus Dormibacteria bacterium]